MDEYDDIRRLLVPRREIKASAELRRRVSLAIAAGHRSTMLRNWLWGGISVSAVAALIMLVLIPGRVSAKDVLAAAVDYLRDAESIDMVVDIRTRPVENFRFIDIHDDFVTHHIQTVSSDSLSWWMVDKGERVATGDADDIYTWIRTLKLGWHITRRDRTDVLGYLTNLLNPRNILEYELQQSRLDSGAGYTVKSDADGIHLSVHSMPQGDFVNPYMLNTSIAESENIRRYIFDAVTKRLKGASVSVIADNREIEVLRITSITYDRMITPRHSLPPDIHFVETENRIDGLQGLSAEEAASTVLNAFHGWDHEILDKVMLPAVADAAYRDRFYGSVLLSVGSAFTSGMGHSVFVPYTLRLSDGTIQKHNLALAKSITEGWIVTGGL